MKKTLQRRLHRFGWPIIKHYVAQYTQSCGVCTRTKSVCPKARAPLKERHKDAQPLENIQIDSTGLLPRDDYGAQSIFVIQNAFSQFAEMQKI